jgi:hypothetical protein
LPPSRLGIPANEQTEKIMRRHYLAITALATLAGGWGVLRSIAEEPKVAPPHHHITAEMEACARACAHCAKECESCLNHCTQMLADGKKEHLATVRSCNDCGDICAMAGKLIARDGAFANLMCVACAKACDGCGAECAKFPNDEHMTVCAKACKECATACREMVKAEGGTGAQ